MSTNGHVSTAAGPTRRPRPPWRRWASVLSAVLVFLATAVVSMTPSAANHGTIFELEGDTVDDPVGSPWDWTKFFGATGDRITPLPAGFEDSAFDVDHAFPDPSTFTGGSKDTLDIPGWSCTDSNNLGGKFDIVNAYSTIYEVPSTGGGYTAGDLLLFFGIERAATEGDGNMGFWFLQDGAVDCERPVGSTGKAPAFSGVHKDGDVFVVAGFSNGGTQATVTAYEWVDTDGSGPVEGYLDVDNPFVTGALCGTTTHDACGAVNLSELSNESPNSTKPWPSPDKNGGDLDINAFYEGFVRVPASQAASCFATFVANTRSSTSPTATIMDFSRGSFPTCQPSTTLSATPAPDATTGNATKVVVVGDSVTYSFTETNDGNTPLTLVKVVTDNTACNTAMTPSGTVSLAIGASQVFSCTIATDSTTPAVTTVVGTGEGYDTLGRKVTYCTGTPPANTICDTDERATAKAASILPGTELTAAANPTTAKAGDSITFTFTEKNDGTAPAGYESYLDLTSVGITTSSTACNSTLARTIPAGTTDQTLSQNETWTYTCTVTAPSSSFSIVATGTGTVLAGTAHARVVTYSAPTGTPPVATCVNASGTSTTTGKFCDSQEMASASVTIIAPSTELTVTADALITYTFREKNDSSDAPLTLPTAGARTSLISTEEGVTTVCNDPANPLTFVGSDGNTDLVLDPGETWTFTCKGTLSGPTGDTGSSSKVATGIGHGIDGTGDDVTYCSGAAPANTLCDTSERDRVTVTITNQARGDDPAPPT